MVGAITKEDEEVHYYQLCRDLWNSYRPSRFVFVDIATLPEEFGDEIDKLVSEAVKSA